VEGQHEANRASAARDELPQRFGGMAPGGGLEKSRGHCREHHPPAGVPPSGPMSTIQSASAITSRLCSISTTMLPASTSIAGLATHVAIVRNRQTKWVRLEYPNVFRAGATAWLTMSCTVRTIRVKK
jgi:hypothetical protein